MDNVTRAMIWITVAIFLIATIGGEVFRWLTVESLYTVL